MRSKIIGLFVLLCATFLLTGCMTPEQRLGMAKDQCSSFGFNPGTTDYARCVQKQNNAIVKKEQTEDSTFQQRRIADALGRDRK